MEPPAPKNPPTSSLITPSISPPSSRFFFPPPYKLSDTASPRKRQRLSSNPPPTQRQGSSSSIANPDGVNNIKEREASTIRLLEFWSSLADRYSRRLDEDDIIDLPSGKIIKDRGVITGLKKKKFAFGSLADSETDDPGREPDSEVPWGVEADGDDGDGDEEEEEEVDELDTFVELDAQKNLEAIAAGGRSVPPLRTMDPADAKDLKEFLEAERKRKGGRVVEEEEAFPPSDWITEHEEDDESSDDQLDGATSEPELPPTSEPNDYTDDEPSSPIYARPLSDDSGSDDELGGWGPDEGSMVIPVLKAETESESDSEVEIVEPPHPVSVRPTSQPLKRSHTLPVFKAPEPPRQQLHTPPLSNSSSSVPSASTPFDDYELPFPETSSPLPPSSPPTSSFYGSSPLPSPTKTRPLSSRATPKSGQTRRISTPSPTRFEAGLPPIPHLDLAKVARVQSSPKPTPKSTPKIPSSPYSSKPKSLRSEPVGKTATPSPVAPRENTQPSVKSKLRVEVVIDHHRAKSRPPVPDEETAVTSDDEGVLNPSRKGKERAPSRGLDDRTRVPAASEKYSEQVIDLTSSPPLLRKGRPRKSHAAAPPTPIPVSREAEKSGSSELHRSQPLKKVGESSQMAFPPTVKGARKRKRIVSVETVASDADASEDAPIVSQPDDSSSKKKASLIPPKSPARRGGSRAKSRQPSSDSESDTDSRTTTSRQPTYRAPSHPGPYHSSSDPPYYPYGSYLSPPPHARGPQMYPPPPAQHAQLISQTLQQLSALLGGGWLPPPGPLSNHRSATPMGYGPPPGNYYAMHGSGGGGANGSTGMYPPTPPLMHQHPQYQQHPGPSHHPQPHPHQYQHSYAQGYDPAFAGAAGRGSSFTSSDTSEGLAPITPVRERRKSLVGRSRSRGRHVSFRVEGGNEESGDAMDISPQGEKVVREAATVKERVDVGEERGRAKEKKAERREGKRREGSLESLDEQALAELEKVAGDVTVKSVGQAKVKGEKKQTAKKSSVRGKERLASRSESEDERDDRRLGRPVDRGRTPGPSSDVERGRGAHRTPGGTRGGKKDGSVRGQASRGRGRGKNT